MAAVREVPVVFLAVFVVTEDGIGGADSDEAVRGVWVILVTVGVVSFAQFEVTSGSCVRLWVGEVRGRKENCFLISMRVACCGRPKVS